MFKKWCFQNIQKCYVFQRKSQTIFFSSSKFLFKGKLYFYLSASSMSDYYEWLPWTLRWAEHNTQQIYDAKSQREPRWLCWWRSLNRSLNCVGWGFGFRTQNSEFRIQDPGDWEYWGALWACHFSHSICLGVWALMALYLYLPHAACHCICLSLKCKKGFEHFPSAIATGISRLQLPLMPAKCLYAIFFATLS